MAVFTGLPRELVLHIATFLTRETVLDSGMRLVVYKLRQPELVPDLPSVNALCRTCTGFYLTLNETLYKLCATDQSLAKHALLFAVEHELGDTLDKLIAAGISLDAHYDLNHKRASLLHVAAHMGARSAVVKLLEMYRDEMMAKVHARRDRWTALDYAAHNGHMDVVGILAPIPFPSGVPKDVSEESNSDEPETQAEYLSHGLLQSARAGYLEISQYLISEGAQINFINDYFSGTTPLSSAAAADNLGLVQLLLASGADPNLSAACGRVPIFAATSLDVVHALVDAGANIHAEDNRSRTVLVLVRDIELLRFFLEHGADPNHQDFLGETPLHCACRRSQKACVELLLQFGAAASVEFKANGRTPVNIAMRRGTPEIVKILEPFVQDPEFKREIAKWLKDGEDIG